MLSNRTITICLSLFILYSWSKSTLIVYDGIVKYRHCARVMYDGSSFKGWQDQDGNERTIQGTISKRISQRFDSTIKVTGAGRTDQGVHSKGQAIHFDIPIQLSTPNERNTFEYTMNRLLPGDIRIYNTSIAPLGNSEQVLNNDPWHATKSSTSKIYSYSFTINPFVDPRKRKYCAHIYYPIDLNKFQCCLQHFIGTHNFIAFTNRVESTKKDFIDRNMEFSCIKTIYSFDFIDNGNGYFTVNCHLQGALYKMVRNIIGTSLSVAAGRLSEEKLLEYLHTGKYDRNDNKSKSAPSEGLCLEHVFYDHY